MTAQIRESLEKQLAELREKLPGGKSNNQDYLDCVTTRMRTDNDEYSLRAELIFIEVVNAEIPVDSLERLNLNHLRISYRSVVGANAHTTTRNRWNNDTVRGQAKCLLKSVKAIQPARKAG